MTIFEFAKKNGLVLEELPRYSDRNPKYELWAPEGKRYIDGVHSFICYDAKDVREQIKGIGKGPNGVASYLEDCPEDCGCKEEPL